MRSLPTYYINFELYVYKMKFHFSLGYLPWWQDVLLLQHKWGHVYNALSSENVLIY